MLSFIDGGMYWPSSRLMYNKHSNGLGAKDTNSNEREKGIVEKLRRSGSLKIAEDAKFFGVSLSTFHRDLSKLERMGVIKRVRGGALLAETGQIEAFYDFRMKDNVAEKKEIAKKASRFVEDGSSIFLDHSTTSTFLAEEFLTHNFRNLNILTNSIAIASVFGGTKGIQIHLTGGLYNHEFKALWGPWVIKSVKGVNLDQIFVSVGTISVDRGLMTQNPFIQELIAELLHVDGQVNVLVDHHKFNRVSSFLIAPLKSSFRIISDKGLHDTTIIQIKEKGIELII